MFWHPSDDPTMLGLNVIYFCINAFNFLYTCVYMQLYKLAYTAFLCVVFV